MTDAPGGPPRTLLDLVRARASRRPDALALVGAGCQRTWADLETRTAAAAAAFARLGVRTGDRVGILASNSPAWLEAFLAIHRAGAVVVPINYRLAPAECARLLEDAGVTALALSPELRGAAPFDGPTLLLDGRFPPADAAAVPALTLEPDDLAVIAYTSGTTGMPKGVIWTHGTLLASAVMNPFPPELARGNRILLCAPLCAGGALIMASNALATGATLVITAFEPHAVLRALAEDDIPFTGLVPTMIDLLVDAAPRGWRAPALRRIYYGAGTMRPPLFARAREVFGCEFQQAYGMTETAILGTRLDPADHVPERLASAGRPMPGVRIKIIDDAGVTVPPGTPGEICIASPGNTPGYWQRPQETRRAVDGPWYRTRDVGRFDDAGFLYLLDRQDDMVKSGGFNVSPAEVEAVLLAHPAVEEVAVIGVPDARWGQRITAIVRQRPGAAVDPQALADFCRPSLAGYKIPRTIVLAEEPLPRNALGKLLRQPLRARYGTQGGGA